MGIVGISPTISASSIATCRGTNGSTRHSWWFVSPHFRFCLRRPADRRHSIAVFDREEFNTTGKSNENQYRAYSQGASRPPQVQESIFPPVSMKNKSSMMRDPGNQASYVGSASANASQWRELADGVKRKRIKTKILQQFSNNSLSNSNDNAICSSTLEDNHPVPVSSVTLEDHPVLVSSITLEDLRVPVSSVTRKDHPVPVSSATLENHSITDSSGTLEGHPVTVPNTFLQNEGSCTTKKIVNSFSMPQDAEMAGTNHFGMHKLALPNLEDYSNKTKSLSMSHLKDGPSRGNSEEKPCEINGITRECVVETSKPSISGSSIQEDHSKTICSGKNQKDLSDIFERVLIVDTLAAAKETVQLLTTKYRGIVHACDTEVAKINVKEETPVDHGEIICFSIYSGPEADFGDGKSYIWVDVLDGERNILQEFAPFFEDCTIRKVWHNYSFDFHVIRNYGIDVSGLHADTMHLARLWDSSRKIDGGYSLEALSSDSRVMSRGYSSQHHGLKLNPDSHDLMIGKVSMKDLFGKKRLKADGSEGKTTTIAPVEELQREARKSWICYSVRDSFNTLMLFKSLKEKLINMHWIFNGTRKGTMFDFYEEYWQPFGTVLVEMEAAGMLVDREYLSVIEKVAISEQQHAAEKFRKWATKYCPDAKYMNVGSDMQLRQLFFGGIANAKNQSEFLPHSRCFKVPNVEKIIEDGKTSPSKWINITLKKIGDPLHAELFTNTGWPSIGVDALRILAGKVSADISDLEGDNLSADAEPAGQGYMSKWEKPKELSEYGTAYAAFGKGRDGMNACHAIAALCEICSIDSLISNFILPLQGDAISGKDGRIHCSLNINTETGRLSCRRPNLQNPPALEKDRYKIRQAFIAPPGKSLIVADYGQLELRILAHLASCKSMLDAFKAGGDFHSRTAMNMYPYIREAIERKEVLLEWHPQNGEEGPPAPLIKDAFASERRKAKMLNFSIAYGKTPVGLSKDWKVSVREAKKTVQLWYNGRKEVLEWQEERRKEAVEKKKVHTLLGRARRFPSVHNLSKSQRGHIERAAINTPVQGSAADVAMCAMLEIARNHRLKQLGWKLVLQVHDEVILEGPSESAEEAKAIVIECMSKPFHGKNILQVDLAVDAKCAQTWYAAK